MTQEQNSKIQQTIEKLAMDFEATFESGNTSDLAEFYSENGMLLPAGSDFIEGRPAIQEYWQVAVDMGIKNIKLNVIEIEQHGDTVIEISKYTLIDVSGQVIDNGKGIAIWKSIDGVWKLHRDIWNSNLTPQ